VRGIAMKAMRRETLNPLPTAVSSQGPRVPSLRWRLRTNAGIKVGSLAETGRAALFDLSAGKTGKARSNIKH